MLNSLRPNIKRHVSRLLSRACVVLMVLFISGCSTFSFIFERLDWFAIWRIDNMFDLSEEQEDQLQPDLIALQQWMRKEGFPETISRLEVLLELWDADKPESAYRYLVSSMDSLNSLYLNAINASAVKFSMRLTEENARQYREYSNEEQENWFDSTRSLEASIDNETERFEKWFGHLNDKQITLIVDGSSLTENEQQIRIDNHLSWREAYLQAAINRNAPLIRAWLGDLSIFWTPEYTMLKQHNSQQRQALVMALLPTLTLKQKRHAREELEDWIEILRDELPEDQHPDT
jgi:hypothetical protein